MASFSETWRNLNPGRKRRFVLLVFFVAVIAGSVVAYKVNRSSRPLANTQDTKKPVILDNRIIEKSMVAESEKSRRELEIEVADIKKTLDDLKREKEKQSSDTERQARNIHKASPSRKTLNIPPPPPPLALNSNPSTERIVPLREMIGEITIVSNPFSDGIVEKSSDKKKGVTSVYLPPSFMEATLLTGLDAETVESAQAQPEPVLLRIKDLAVLPNRIKANLNGCFAIAHGYGKLSKERVLLRLVTLSCLAKDGRSVIDQSVKGFVADEDGKNGLRGNVVSRMGASISYATMAGIFGGAGDALSAAATTQSTSPLGSTAIIESTNLEKAAIGGGLSSGSKEIQRLFLELARQATPIIEVGATKTVTLIITEGVTLEIKDTCIGDQECDN